MPTFSIAEIAHVQNDQPLQQIEELVMRLRQLEAGWSAQWGAQDGRPQAANRIAGALQSVMALRIFEISVFPHPNFWSDFFQAVPTPADLAGHQGEMSAAMRFLTFQVTFSAFESDLRKMLSALRPNAAATAPFASIAQQVIADAQSTSGFSELMKLLRLVRNTIHNNGVFHPQTPGNDSVRYGGIVYNFTDGQPLDFVDWQFIFRCIDGMADFLATLMADPAVSSLEAV